MKLGPTASNRLNIILLFLSVISVSSITNAAKLNSGTAENLQQTTQAFGYSQQQSHNCNYNIDRLKKGPVDWTKIEGTGKIFTDHSFPADQSMLSWKEYPRTVGGLSRYLPWFKDYRRPKDLHNLHHPKDQVPGVSLFGKDWETSRKLATSGFEQGTLGDNYFLTVVAALAQRGNMIPNMFHQKKYTHEGIFALKVFVKGRPEDVTVDDLFPIYDNQPAFAKPTSDGGWWLPLLEKAYAKVHVNYEMTGTGSHAEAARFLTNAPSREFETNLQASDELWNALTRAVTQKYIITAACFVEHSGLLPGQGYIVQQFTEYQGAEGKPVRLIKILNPWKKSSDATAANAQKFEWSGRYSKFDKTWSDADKLKAGNDKLHSGEFMMSVDDFKDAFKHYTVTYIHDNYHNSFVEKRQALNKKNYRFNFTITDEDVGAPVSSANAEPPAPAAAPAQPAAAPQPPKEESNDPRQPPLNPAGELPDVPATQAPAAAQQNISLESDVDDDQDIQQSSSLRIKKRKGKPGNAINLMVNSEGDGDGDANEEQEEEDEDDEMQSAISDQDVEDTNNDSQIKKQDNDLAQIAKFHHQYKKKDAEINLDGDLQSLAQGPNENGQPAEQTNEKKEAESSNEGISRGPGLEAYIGAEMYARRLYPTGCPGFQKMAIKLFRVVKGRMQLVDSNYANNREGFGYMLRNLPKGDYQLQVKKYSFGLDTYDFVARIYSKRNIKLIDVEQQQIEKEKKKHEKRKENVGQSRTITENNNPTSHDEHVRKHFTKAGDQDTNEKRMIDIDPFTQIDMELHKSEIAKDIELEEVKQAEKGTSNGYVEIIKGPLQGKLNKAIKLASDSRADQFFEIHKREFYYMKDAIDKKHGFYFLRVGSNSDKFDLTLKIKMFVKGELVESTERNEKLYVYKYPEDKFPGDYKLTTFCSIRPLRGKKTCDFLIPTQYHDRTYVYIQNKVPASRR